MDKKDKAKRIVFESSTHKHAQLKVRLQYDSMTQAEFFRCLIDGYLNKDERILGYLQDYRISKGKDSKRNAKYRKKDLEKADDLLNKFGIKDDELENIFDLIEEEFPDL
tara:strand:- start:677 stop:1003 length:327 start_codon:yes stop_codon:yes gene_type:complete